MAKVKSKTLIIIKSYTSYSLMAFINTNRKKRENGITNIMNLDEPRSISHVKDLLFNNWSDKVFMVIYPENIPDKVLLQPYLDLKIKLLK